MNRMGKRRRFASTKNRMLRVYNRGVGRESTRQNCFEERDSCYLFMQACRMCRPSTHLWKILDALQNEHGEQRAVNRNLPEASLTSLNDTWSNPASLSASINASLSLFRNTEGSKLEIAWNFVPETMTPPGFRTLKTSRSDSSSGSQKYTQFWLKICERFTDVTSRDSVSAIFHCISVCRLFSCALERVAAKRTFGTKLSAELRPPHTHDPKQTPNQSTATPTQQTDRSMAGLLAAPTLNSEPSTANTWPSAANSEHSTSPCQLTSP